VDPCDNLIDALWPKCPNECRVSQVSLVDGDHLRHVCHGGSWKIAFASIQKHIPPAESRRPFKHGAHSPTDTFKYLIILRILGAIHLVEVREEFSLVGSRKRRLDDPAAWQEGGISVGSTPRPIMLAGG